MVSPYLLLPLREHAQAVEEAHDQRRHQPTWRCRDCYGELRTRDEKEYGLCWSCSRDRAGNGPATGQREDTGYE